jgi:site-specific recombinase XerD
MLGRRARATGIEVFPHKTRHTACTLMLKRGMDLHTVSQIMGHTQLSTTQAYLSLTPADIAAKHAAASPFLALQAQLADEAPTPPPPRKRRLRERVA